MKVLFPASRPLVPDTPAGIPPPTSMDFIEEYLPYLITDKKAEKEMYTYGQDIEFQLQPIIDMYRKEGYNTNHGCITVGSKYSICLEHSQCLRLIDTRILNGKLNFIIYFRSWDLWGGFPANLAAIQIMKEYMSSEIGISDGELLAFSKGLHLYDHCWELAEILINR